MAIQGNSKRIAFWASSFRTAEERKKITYQIFVELQVEKGSLRIVFTIDVSLRPKGYRSNPPGRFIIV
jgi:hypothetical protein